MAFPEIFVKGAEKAVMFIIIIYIYTVCIKIKVIHFQRPIVLKSIDLNICM